MRRKLVVLTLAVAGLFTIAPAQAGFAGSGVNGDPLQKPTGYDWCC
jgi:hypothetical protein